MPNVDLEKCSKLDSIHARRMMHAFAQVLGRLLLIEDQRVQAILSHWDITLMPGPRVGIEYPDGAKQILEFELNQEKEKLAIASTKKEIKAAKKSKKTTRKKHSK